MNYFLVETVLGISVIPFKDFSAFGCIANVVMLMPLGFFLPLLWKNCRSFWKMFVAGCVVSIFIESLQLFTFRATDIDDLLMNTLGGGSGIWVLCSSNKMASRLERNMEQSCTKPTGKTGMYQCIFSGDCFENTHISLAF